MLEYSSCEFKTYFIKLCVHFVNSSSTVGRKFKKEFYLQIRDAVYVIWNYACSNLHMPILKDSNELSYDCNKLKDSKQSLIS